MHPTAGAVAIGASPFLVAFNVYLGPASNLAIAKQVAKAVRIPPVASDTSKRSASRPTDRPRYQ